MFLGHMSSAEKNYNKQQLATVDALHEDRNTKSPVCRLQLARCMAASAIK